jgi:isoleucyl-tRNA synthetase
VVSTQSTTRYCKRFFFFFFFFASRRAAQTTLFHIYNYLQEVLAPITPILVEESWEHAPEAVKSQCEHPMKRIVSAPAPEWQNPALETEYQDLMAVHSVIKTVQETARGKKELGSSLQSFVHIVLTGEDVTDSVLQRYLSELPDLFVVSSVSLSARNEPIPSSIQNAEWQYTEQFELPGGQKGVVYVYTPQDAKCPRCWRYAVPESATAEQEEERLCDRCDEVVRELDAKAA